ncbi:hypothetical protein EDC04DRAFT_2969229 [Pisolithus marmoratus]|nr:hypothetical protein EDC04DRAFT_2969229 [Pisolithus marmoratus]
MSPLLIEVNSSCKVELILLPHDCVQCQLPTCWMDLTKVCLQSLGEKHMIESMHKTLWNAGVHGLFDGVSGMWLRQMRYSLCHFWAYDESKKFPGSGNHTGSITGIVGNPGEVIMVHLQGDFAKPPEKHFNYKHCFDALFRELVICPIWPDKAHACRHSTSPGTLNVCMNSSSHLGSVVVASTTIPPQTPGLVVMMEQTMDWIFYHPYVSPAPIFPMGTSLWWPLESSSFLLGMGIMAVKFETTDVILDEYTCKHNVSVLAADNLTDHTKN